MKHNIYNESPISSSFHQGSPGKLQAQSIFHAHRRQANTSFCPPTSQENKSQSSIHSLSPPWSTRPRLGQGWEFLAMTDDDWINAHHLKHGTDPDEELSDTDDESVPVPVMPVINNPGYFEIGSTWKEFKILPEREIHSQKLQSFL